MKKNSVRIFCIILSAMLLLSVLPVMSFAATSYKVYDAAGIEYELSEGVNPSNPALVNKITWTQENKYSAYRLVLNGFNGTAITATGDLYIEVKADSSLSGGVLAPSSTGYGACIAATGNIHLFMYNGATLTIKPDAVKAGKQHAVGIYASTGSVTLNNNTGKVVIDATNSSNGRCYGIYSKVTVNNAVLDITATSTNSAATYCYGINGNVSIGSASAVTVKINPGSAQYNFCVNGLVTYESTFTGKTAFINGADATKINGTSPALSTAPVYNSLSSTNILRFGKYSYSAFGVSNPASAGSSSSITAAKLCADLASVRPQVGKALAATVEHEDYILRLTWSDGHGGSFAAGTIAKEGVAYNLNAYIVPLTAIQLNQTAASEMSSYTTTSSLAKYSWMFSQLGILLGSLNGSQLSQVPNGTNVKAIFKAATAGKEPSINPANSEIILTEGEKVSLTVYTENCTATVWEKKLPGSSTWNTLKAGGLYTTVDYTASGDFNGTEFRITGYAPGYADVTTSITIKEANTIKITNQPVSAIADSEGKVTFSVAATGKYELSYQWYYENSSGTVNKASAQVGPTKFEGMTTDTLKIKNSASFVSNYKFFCKITDKKGNEVTTDKVSVIVPASIEIKEQPANAVIKNKAVSFTVKAESTVPLTYQWYIGSSPATDKTYSTGFTVSGATTDTLKITNVIPYLQSQEIYCVITNTQGTRVETNKVGITSEIHDITITTQPVSVSVDYNNTVTFKVVAETDEAAKPITYTWYMNGSAMENRTFGEPNNQIMGADTATLSILYATDVFFTDAEFWCEVTNADGSKAVSDKVKATVGKQSEEVTVTPGDIDNNGKVEVVDARLALRAAIKLESYAEGSREFKAADVDRKDGITVSDARSILRVAIKLDSADIWKK